LAAKTSYTVHGGPLSSERERAYSPASIKAMIEIVKQMPRHIVRAHTACQSRGFSNMVGSCCECLRHLQPLP